MLSDINEIKDFIQKEIIKAVESVVDKKLKELKFDTTLRGKVISYSGGIAKVEINDKTYNCTCSITVTANKSVRVIAPNNDYKRLYVDAVL